MNALRFILIRPITWATIVALVWSGLIPAPAVRAVDTSRTNFVNSFYYNSLISDVDFLDINSMGVTDIQHFLEDKNSYLKQFSENNRSAAQIIYDAAHGYNEASGTLSGIAINTSTGTVSPRALLVTLQKEQSLITLTSADRDLNVDQYGRRLERAMGYACPDGNSCDSRYLGFTKQVENAAWQFRYNHERAQGHGFSDYQVGQTASMSDSTGSYSVTFSNRATASLYRYTPHVFNGNYNFWSLFNTWFTPNSFATPSSVTYTNDLSSVSAKTYNGTYKIEGTKETDGRVIFNGVEIASPGSNRWSLEFTPDVATKDYTLDYRNSSNVVVGTKHITIERHGKGDVNGDNKVNLQDLSMLATTFGQGVPDGDWSDLNADAQVNLLDLSILADKWTG